MEHGSNPRVVVVFPGALGDLVLAMPTLARLRARHRGAHLTLVVAGWLTALAATAGVADATASLDAAEAAGLFGGTRVPAWMRDRPVVYAWIGAGDPAVRERLDALGATVTLARVVRDDGPEHAAAVYARAVGLGDPVPFVWPAPACPARVARLVAARRRPLLAVHAGAGAAAKRWAPAAFAAVAARWQADGGDVVEIVGPAEATLPRLGGVAVEWPLPDLVALLARVDAYVGNDSGVTHLAAAAGAGGVALYGPTPARRWAPFGGRVLPIQAEGWRPDGIPADAVAAERVWRAVHAAAEARRDLDKVPGRA